MHIMMPEELQHLMLHMLFKGARGPQRLFAGLSTAPPTRMRLADVLQGELQVEGYGRQSITLESCTVTRSPCEVSTGELVFRNGGKKPWPTVKSVFIATDHGEGSVLVAWLPLDHERSLLSGDLLKISVNLAYGGGDGDKA